MFQLHHVVLVILTLHGVMAAVTTKKTTGTSTKPTATSTTVPSTTVKSTTTVITTTSPTSKPTTCKPTTSTAASAGRRKRDVDNEKSVETDGVDPVPHVQSCDENSSVAVVHGYTIIVMAFAAFVIIYKERI